MSGTWYPSMDQPAVEAWRADPRAFDDEQDRETLLLSLATEGDVEALLALRHELDPVAYDELGWGD